MQQKLYDTAATALDGLKDQGVIHDGCTVMVGGFGLCGIPEHLIIALRDTGVKDITCISNNAGVDDWGLGLLLATRQIRKMISSYVGENDEFARQFLEKELEVEFNPQGTLAERIRAGGAGIPAFYTATGVGTTVAEGKDVRDWVRPCDDTKHFNRPPRAETPLGSGACAGKPRPYVLETGLYADLALVKADTADEFGNLTYRMTARNFNPMMAGAAKFVIAEVDSVVGLGDIDPDNVHTPGSYIDRFVKTKSEKRIEQRTTREG